MARPPPKNVKRVTTPPAGYSSPESMQRLIEKFPHSASAGRARSYLASTQAEEQRIAAEEKKIIEERKALEEKSKEEAEIKQVSAAEIESPAKISGADVFPGFLPQVSTLGAITTRVDPDKPKAVPMIEQPRARPPKDQTIPEMVVTGFEQSGFYVPKPEKYTPPKGTEFFGQGFGESRLSEEEFATKQEFIRRQELPVGTRLAEDIFPGYKEERLDYLKRLEAEQERSTKKIEAGLATGGFLIGLQERFKFQEEQEATQQRVTAFQERLQTGVTAGDISFDFAQEQLKGFAEREQTALELKAEDFQKGYEERVNIVLTPFKEKAISREEARLQKEFGMGFGINEFFLAGADKPEGQARIRKALGAKQISGAIKELETTKTQFLDIAGKGEATKSLELFETGQIKLKDIKVQREITTYAQIGSLLEKEGPKFDFVLDIGVGAIRKPVTTAATFGLVAATAGVGSFVAPSLAVSTSTTAKVALGVGKVGTYALGGAFVGVSGFRIAVAPTKEEQAKIIGETFAIGAAGLAGGLVGARVGTGLFQRRLGRLPSTTELTGLEVRKGPDEFIITSKGIMRKGKFEFPFKAKEVIAFKGTRFIRTAEFKPTFLGKPLKTITTTFKGITQQTQGPIPGGVQEFVIGKIKFGRTTRPLEFRVFRDELIGTFGKEGFTTKILSSKIIGPEQLQFKLKQITTPIKTKPIKRLGRITLRGITLPGKLLVGAAGTETIVPGGSITFPRGEITPTPTPRIKTIVPSIRFAPSISPETSFFAIPSPSIITLVPTIQRTIPKIKLDVSTRAVGISPIKTGPLSISRLIGQAGILPGTEPVGITGVKSLTIAGTEPFYDVGGIRTPTTFTPPFSPPFIPLFPLPKLPLGGAGGFRRSAFGKAIRRPTKYQASLVAGIRKIYGPEPLIKTGLGIRPLMRF